MVPAAFWTRPAGRTEPAVTTANPAKPAQTVAPPPMATQGATARAATRETWARHRPRRPAPAARVALAATQAAARSTLQAAPSRSLSQRSRRTTPSAATGGPAVVETTEPDRDEEARAGMAVSAAPAAMAATTRAVQVETEATAPGVASAATEATAARVVKGSTAPTAARAAPVEMARAGPSIWPVAV